MTETENLKKFPCAKLEISLEKQGTAYLRIFFARILNFSESCVRFPQTLLIV